MWHFQAQCNSGWPLPPIVVWALGLMFSSLSVNPSGGLFLAHPLTLTVSCGCLSPSHFGKNTGYPGGRPSPSCSESQVQTLLPGMAPDQALSSITGVPVLGSLLSCEGGPCRSLLPCEGGPCRSQHLWTLPRACLAVPICCCSFPWSPQCAPCSLELGARESPDC